MKCQELVSGLRILALARESWEKEKWRPCGVLAVLSRLVEQLPQRMRRCVEIMDIYREDFEDEPGGALMAAAEELGCEAATVYRIRERALRHLALLLESVEASKPDETGER